MLPNGKMKDYYVAYGCPKPREKKLRICFVGRAAENPKTPVSLGRVFDEAVDTSLWRDIPYENDVMSGPVPSQ